MEKFTINIKKMLFVAFKDNDNIALEFIYELLKDKMKPGKIYALFNECREATKEEYVKTVSAIDDDFLSFRTPRQKAIEFINAGRQYRKLDNNLHGMCMMFQIGYSAKRNEMTDKEFFDLLTREERLLYAIYND